MTATTSISRPFGTTVDVRHVDVDLVRGGRWSPLRPCVQRQAISLVSVSALRQKAGLITAAGMAREVSFQPVEGPILQRIDEAYRIKYRTSKYLAPMTGQHARAATVQIVPRAVEG